MAERKARLGVISYFKKIQKLTTGRSETINIYSAQWAADALVESYTYDGTKALVDRYFKVSQSPSWKTFVYNSEKIYDEFVAEKEDREKRLIMKQRVAAWLHE
jgi:CTP:phosphocholine cytidylyltransferase-like protein